MGDSAEGKPTQAGGTLPEGRAVRLLKLTDGTRFQWKRAAARTIPLTPAKVGIFARRVKSNIQSGGM